MLSLLKCFGLNESAGAMLGAQQSSTYFDQAGLKISKHARGMLARKDTEQRRKASEKAAADRVAAKLDVRRMLKKASRRGYGVYSARRVYLSDDERSLVYAKPNVQDIEKTLPFAQMEPPTASGNVVTISMRNQAKATSVYKFQAATDAEAKVWAHALNLFVPPTVLRKGLSALNASAAA